MTDTSTVYLEVDGKPHPAADLHWLGIEPCGCVGGVSRALSAGELHQSGEDAFHRDDPKVKREQSRKRGVTYKLITHQQYRDTWMKRLQADCPHTPKWGVEPIPVPEGWTWKTLDGYLGSRSYRKHIVPIVENPGIRNPTAAACGAVDKRSYWRDDRDRLSDCVPCSKCEKVAHNNPPDPIPALVEDVAVQGGLL